MSELLALEWNDREARMAVAASRAGGIVIEHAFSVTLLSGQVSGDPAEVDVGGRIAAALAARGIGRIDTLVAVGRSHIELRQLALPPAPDSELPDMVRFQAMREFNKLDERWLLDFIPTDDSAEGPRSVLAAALDPELAEQIERTCQTANLKPRRLILRPCAAASLLGRVPSPGPSQLKLLVDLLDDEADLTVLIDRKVVFLRTTRLGGDPLTEAGYAEALLSEIRRTMAAAQNQLGGRQVESIALCGHGELHAALAKSIEENLSTPTELFDPFGGLQLSRELRGALPDHPGRFAPLLGMALAELEQTGHAVDFLHPRRRPEPIGRQSRYVMIGLAAALVVALYFGYGWWQQSSLTRSIQRLSAETTLLDKRVAQADQAKKAVAEIEKWTATDVVWLDELRRLSAAFPPAKEAMATQLTLSRASPNGGQMLLEGLAREPSAITDLERQLREDKWRGVEGTGSSQDSSTKQYSWKFSSTLSVAPEDK